LPSVIRSALLWLLLAGSAVQSYVGYEEKNNSPHTFSRYANSNGDPTMGDYECFGDNQTISMIFSLVCTYLDVACSINLKVIFSSNQSFEARMRGEKAVHNPHYQAEMQVELYWEKQAHDAVATDPHCTRSDSILVKVVQEMLGHSQISMTMDIYSHVRPTIQRDAVGELNVVLEG
jgi:hypothetical protein